MKLLLIAAVSATGILAQYTSLSTDYTGETLFFTADFMQTGKEQPAYGKLFLADREGIRPFVIRERTESEYNFFEPGSVTNHFNLVGVDLSSNGSRISLGGRRECRQRSTICGFNESSDVYNEEGKPSFTTNGLLSFSPNGAWALGVGWHVNGPTTLLVAYETSTGKSHLIGDSTFRRDWRTHDIADDGTVIIATSASPMLFRAGERSTLIQIFSDTVYASAIDAAGSTIVVQAGFGTRAGIEFWKVGTSAAATSLRVEGRVDFAPKISDDGTQILFLSSPADADDPQVFVMRADGLQRRQLAAIPEGVRGAILSGNGMTAWVVSRTGRLLKIAVPSGVVQEWIGPVGFFHSSCAGKPGEVVSVRASVMPGEAIEVLVGSERAEVIEVGTQHISFRIPGATKLGDSLVTIRKRDGDAGWMGKPMVFTITDMLAGANSCVSDLSLPLL